MEHVKVTNNRLYKYRKLTCLTFPLHSHVLPCHPHIFMICFMQNIFLVKIFQDCHLSS